MQNGVGEDHGDEHEEAEAAGLPRRFGRFNPTCFQSRWNIDARCQQDFNSVVIGFCFCHLFTL